MRRFLFAVCCIAVLSFAFTGCSNDGGGKKKINDVASYTITISGSPSPGTYTASILFYVTAIATVTNDITGETVNNPVITWNGANSSTTIVAMLSTSHSGTHTITASFSHNGTTYTSNELVYNVTITPFTSPM